MPYFEVDKKVSILHVVFLIRPPHYACIAARTVDPEVHVAQYAEAISTTFLATYISDPEGNS